MKPYSLKGNLQIQLNVHMNKDERVYTERCVSFSWKKGAKVLCTSLRVSKSVRFLLEQLHVSILHAL